MKHLAIIGSPGCGKTHTLIQELRELDTAGLRTLFCSHTRAAASEAVARWGTPSKNLDIQTLHSLGFKINKINQNSVVTDLDFIKFAETIGIDEDDAKFCAELMSYARAGFMQYDEAYEQSTRWISLERFEYMVNSYKGWKNAYGFVDFSDMLELSIHSTAVPKYDRLVIDEAQDLTPLHWAVVDNLIAHSPGCRVVIAGDGNQALYEWSGADPHGMEKFLNKHGGETHELMQSYRVPQSVHDRALSIVARMEKPGPVNYKPRIAAGGGVVEGQVTYFSDPDYMEVSPNVDSLVLYSNKFIRNEIEERLIEDAALYTSIGGKPAPAQTRAGLAVRMAVRIRPGGSGHVPDATSMEVIYKGLREEFARTWNSKGPDAILKSLWEGKVDTLNMYPEHEHYFRRVDWTKPIKTRIGTIHSSKGMEADHVHLIDSQSAAAEEHAVRNPDAAHRQWYVGVTRAREQLSVYRGEQEYGVP